MDDDIKMNADGQAVTLHEATSHYKTEIARLTAGLEEIASAQPTKCKRCKGDGWVWRKWKREGTKTCPRCGGQRKIVFSNDLMSIANRTLKESEGGS